MAARSPSLLSGPHGDGPHLSLPATLPHVCRGESENLGLLSAPVGPAPHREAQGGQWRPPGAVLTALLARVPVCSSGWHVLTSWPWRLQLPPLPGVPTFQRLGRQAPTPALPRPPRRAPEDQRERASHCLSPCRQEMAPAEGETQGQDKDGESLLPGFPTAGRRPHTPGWASLGAGAAAAGVWPSQAQTPYSLCTVTSALDLF